MTLPDDREIVLDCDFPHDLLTKLTAADDIGIIRSQQLDSAAVARGVLDFLADQGCDISVVNSGSEHDSRRYHAVVGGARIQIRMSTLLLDSIRDCIVLAVVVAATARQCGSRVGVRPSLFCKRPLNPNHESSEAVDSDGT